MPRKSQPKSIDEIAEKYEEKIGEVLQDLHQMVHETAEKKDDLDTTLSKIDDLHSSIRTERKLSNYNQSKLKNTYKTALKQAEQEADLLRECLAEIQRVRKLRTEKRVSVRQFLSNNPTASVPDTSRLAPLRRGALMVMLQQSANTMPLWMGKLDECPPPLCGAIPETPEHVCEAGSAVAALVKGQENEHNWILAEIVAYNPQQSKYEIEDVDEEQKERYTVPKRKVIPLPHYRANPQSDADAIYPIDAIVLALYPQTTCFYKGVVEQQPYSPTDDYLVAFDDASYPNGYSPPLPVPQRYVVAYKDVTAKA